MSPAGGEAGGEVASAGGGADFNLRILWPLVTWLREHEGEEALRACAAAGQIPYETLCASEAWVSAAGLEEMLAKMRSYFEDEASFFRGSAYRFAEAYGPLRYVLWATTPQLIFRQSVRSIKVVSKVSHYQVIEDTRGHITLRYTSDLPNESRALCLTRQSAGAHLPTIWGMPPAKVEEGACLAHGDAFCEYTFTYFVGTSWLPTFLGAGLGAAITAALALAGVSDVPAWVALPSLGAALGALFELRRANHSNLKIGAELTDAFAQIAADDAEARQELSGLQQRQSQWVTVLEDHARQRTQALQQVMEGIQGLRERRETALRGFSHDLRNPLAVLRSGLGVVEDYQELLGEDGPLLVEELKDATRSMERMLGELMEVATQQQHQVKLVPERLVVGALADRLRRRLRALALGGGLRTSVLTTRQAPAQVEVDLMVFDRVLDNLLTNAIKYTERGSVVVELSGEPGWFLFKISDTGRGIAPEALSRIFLPGGSTERADHSFGVGLSVVVQLIARVGGRLEVKSERGEGTTFWVWFPETLGQITDRDLFDAEGESPEALAERVVTVRDESAS